MRRIGMAVLGLAALGSNLYGQRSALREVHDRGTFGVTLAIAEPLGEFRNNANLAGGITAYGLTGNRTLGLRIEGSWILYDSDYRGYDFSTTSQIGTLAAGPQLTLGAGPMRFYGFATIGGSLFWSSAHSGCGCYRGDYYLQGDLTSTTSAGGGIQIAVSQRRTPVFIDLGVRGVHHDRVKYIPSGGLSQNPDGSFSADRVETPVDLRVWQIGVSIGIR